MIQQEFGRRTPDLKNTQERPVGQREFGFHVCQPISIAELTGIPPRRDIDRLFFLDQKPHNVLTVYDDFGQAPVTPLVVQDLPGQQREYIVAVSPVKAHTLNSLLFIASGCKDYGLDPLDILDDWAKLFAVDSDIDSPERRRLEAHRAMNGWDFFEPSKDRIYNVIQTGYKPSNGLEYGTFVSNASSSLVPVLRWRKVSDSERIIPAEPLPESLANRLGSVLRVDPGRLDSLTGAIFLAAYSPRWPYISDYGLEKASPPNEMSATQAAAFVARRLVEKQTDSTSVPDNEDIQQSPLLPAFENYCEGE